MTTYTVNPELLIWARETAGLDRETAAHKLGFTNAKGRTAQERLAKLESGEEAVSRAVLAKMSQQYHRPLVTFYMAKPPRRGEVGSDFRTLPEEKRREDAPTLDALLRDVHSRQALVRSLLEEDEDAGKLAFVGSMSLRTTVAEAASQIRECLAFDEDTFRKGSVDHGFNYLRSCVESTGVFVLLLGNLGTYRTNIDAEVFRGLAIADDYAPFVVVNDQDARSAWSFTLLHELVHIWLGQSGISGGAMDARIERFCNDVASTILLPPQELRPSVLEDDEAILAFAKVLSERFNVSRALVIYRLFRQGAIGESDWRSVSDRLRREWRDDRRKMEEAKRRKETSGGPNYYVVQRFHLGRALVDLVRRSVKEGSLSPTRAGQVLGVRATSVHPLIGDKAA